MSAARTLRTPPPPGPGAVEVTYTPVSAAFFASEGNLPSFGNYGFGTAASFRIDRVLGDSKATSAR